MKIKQFMIAKYRSTELGKKILAILLSVSLLQIGMILLISYQLSSSIITEQTRELLYGNLEQSAGNIQDAFERYDRVFQEIYMNTAYTKEVKVINSWDGEDYYLSEHSLESKLQNLIYRNEEILGIAVVGKYGDECFYDRITRSSQISLCFEEGLRRNFLVKEALLQKNSIYSNLVKKTDPEYGEYSCFYIAHQLTDLNQFNRGAIGCVLLCIDEAAFRKVYAQGVEESNLSFLVDSCGNIVSFPIPGYENTNLFGASPGEQMKGQEMEPLKEKALDFIKEVHYFQTENLAVNAVSILDGHFFIINIQDLNYSLEKLRYLLLMICLVAVLAGAVCFMIVYYISMDTDRSVKKIVNAMNDANRGNLESKIEVEGNDEFAQISRHFNDMLAEIKKAGQQERESLVREKNAEIRSLEAQINPHFLYNTLDTVNWQAIESGQLSISQMITKLAQLLRYSIHNSNEIVTIKTELEFLKKYIYLQQQRFEYAFNCTVDLDERAGECRIHKLLIQPLVENTIIHGFSGFEGTGEIHIGIQRLEPDHIEIQVKDNGVGMSREQVDALNHYDYRKDRIETSIGVRNVITRLKLYYGDQGRIVFASDSEGTRVRITIPEMIQRLRELMESLCIENAYVFQTPGEKQAVVLVAGTEKNRGLKSRFALKVLPDLDEIGPCTCVFARMYGLKEIGEVLEQMRGELSFAFSLPDHTILDPELVSEIHYQELEYPQNLEYTMIRELRSGKKEKIDAYGKRFIQEVVEQNGNPEQVREYAIRLIANVFYVAKEIKEYFNQEENMKYFMEMIIRSETRGEVRYQLEKFFHIITQGDQEEILTENGMVMNAISYIRTHYKEEIALSDVARICRVTPEYLSRIFYRETGINFSPFLQNFRISLAKRMLATEDCKVYEVAEAVGFKDQKYFVKVFKKLCGTTPSEYRKEMKA